MDNLGKYLYCIIRCSEERIFHGAAPMGNTDSLVHTVAHLGLAAVVSNSPATEYDATPANLLAHQRVQEKVMKEFTLLPVRFGTVANSASPEQDIRRLLEKRSQEFNALLAEMDGKVELGLKAIWRDEKAVFQEILSQSEEIKALRDSLTGKPPQATHFDRIRLGEMVQKALAQKRAATAAKLLAPLQRIAYRIQDNDVFMDRMVVNTAFLVDRNREGEFDRAIAQLDEELGQQIALKYVGPVPPYNFVNIVVNWQEP